MSKRAKSKEPKQVTVYFKMDVKMADEIAAIAQTSYRTCASVIRMAVTEWLEAKERKATTDQA